MTIKDVAQVTGLSQQAIYKKIKARGIMLEELKDKETGQLSKHGEEVIRDLFSDKKDEKKVEKQDSTEIEKLKAEVEKLRNKVEYLEEKNNQLTEERDFLKTALNQAQQLQALTLARIPAALPPAEKRGIRGWFSRRRGKDEGNE